MKEILLKNISDEKVRALIAFLDKNEMEISSITESLSPRHCALCMTPGSFDDDKFHFRGKYYCQEHVPDHQEKKKKRQVQEDEDGFIEILR
jgi:hypothetical protein